MKSNHTPGPWKAHFNVPTAVIPGHIIKRDDDVQIPIASLWVGGGTHGKTIQIANAKLIAAAPDLLEALEPFAKLAAEVFKSGNENKTTEPLYIFNEAQITYDDLRKVIAAINKITE